MDFIVAPSLCATRGTRARRRSAFPLSDCAEAQERKGAVIPPPRLKARQPSPDPDQGNYKTIERKTIHARTTKSHDGGRRRRVPAAARRASAAPSSAAAARCPPRRRRPPSCCCSGRGQGGGPASSRGAHVGARGRADGSRRHGEKVPKVRSSGALCVVCRAARRPPPVSLWSSSCFSPPPLPNAPRKTSPRNTK